MKEGCVGRVFRGGTRCMRREAAQNPEGLLHKVTGESYVMARCPGRKSLPFGMVHYGVGAELVGPLEDSPVVAMYRFWCVGVRG